MFIDKDSRDWCNRKPKIVSVAIWRMLFTTFWHISLLESRFFFFLSFYPNDVRGWKLIRTTVDSSCVSLACTLCRFNATHGQAWRRWSIGGEWLSCALLHLLCFKGRTEKYIIKFYRFFVLPSRRFVWF